VQALVAKCGDTLGAGVSALLGGAIQVSFSV
jgi:hypothetical protein